jgi:DNA-binding transcriptional ArsR family regulator
VPRGQRTAREDRRYARALSHPTRVRILALLEERVATPRDLADWLDGPTLGAVSHHVRLLHRVGLIRLVRTTSVRGAMSHHYRAAARVRVAGEGWDDAAPIVKHATAAARSRSRRTTSARPRRRTPRPTSPARSSAAAGCGSTSAGGGRRRRASGS